MSNFCIHTNDGTTCPACLGTEEVAPDQQYADAGQHAAVVQTRQSVTTPRSVSFDDLETVTEERDALMCALVEVHEQLSHVGLSLEGMLTERMKAALERMQRAETSARRWKAAAKAFRRRWRDACAEIENDMISVDESEEIVSATQGQTLAERIKNLIHERDDLRGRLLRLGAAVEGQCPVCRGTGAWTHIGEHDMFTTTCGQCGGTGRTLDDEV